MIKYNVQWAVDYTNDDQIEHHSVSLEADSPKQAYALFLDSESTVRNVEVIVVWGMFGLQKFSDHIVEAREAEEKGEGMSEGEKQEQLLRMIEDDDDEQKGTAKLTPSTHTPKAENVREAVSGGASKEKAQQARHEFPTRQQDSLDEHKHSLRRTTAYSGLRSYLSITAWLTAIGCVIAGVVSIDENNKGLGVFLLLFGPLVAALQYFIASVYFDIADAGLNTSMRIQDLHRMESSKDPKTEGS
jgi:hypothetical protein